MAGDMFLGAMLDLGIDEQLLRSALARLPLEGYLLTIGRRQHMGISGCDVRVRIEGGRQRQEHVAYRAVRQMIEESALAEGVKARALEIFRRLARAEGRMHQVDPDAVTFHEVGAVDSIVDVVGAAVALDALQPRRVTSRRVPLGHGTTRCAHGTLPVPSPAALAILEGCEVEDGGAEIELCTPTGAAIIAAEVESFGELPAGRVIGSGYGAGDRQLPDRPNHLRVVLLEPSGEPSGEQAVVVSANIDDMNPEWSAYLVERLLEGRARDVWLTPIAMKKGRPGLMISVLCDPSDRVAVEQLLLAESTTIGVRWHRVAREVLPRRARTVQTPYGEITIKEARQGERLVNVAPEFESCRAAAAAHDVPLKEVYAAALVAHRSLASTEPAK
jgi:uncharacterized protein (TIGR00299 family) protein